MGPAGHTRSAIVAALVLVAAATLVLPTASAAAGIEVLESRTSRGEFSSAELYFHDDGAEGNALSIAITGETVPDHYTIEAVDGGSSLTPGKGCQGGGSPGAPVTCLLHQPVGPCAEGGCGGDCRQMSPGTGWLTRLRVDLGDGDNSLRTSGFTSGTCRALVDTEVKTGVGDDRIETGAGETTVVMSAVPGGRDLYDLGAGRDRVTYEQRVTPIVLRESIVSSGGESGSLVGVDCLAAGSGEDTLVGGPGPDCFEGGPGADTLFGHGGSDELFGAQGDDVLRGGQGDDEFDGGAGGEGDDAYQGGPGDDTIEAGPGHDVIHGGAGRDQLAGGAGGDVLHGGRGTDSLTANNGSQTHDRDFADCGPGLDRVLVDPWDRLRGCEAVKRASF